MKRMKKGPADFRIMPWRNGLGITREMHIAPDGASLEAGDFLWRLSSADVAVGGPFSPFPGYDRVLFLLSGGGMDLAVNGTGASLAEPYSSIAFRGEDDVRCSLRGGPAVDFNIITRRDRLACAYELMDQFDGETPILLAGSVTVLLCLRGEAEVCGAIQERLRPMELAVLEDYEPGTALSIGSPEPSKVLRITLTDR